MKVSRSPHAAPVPASGWPFGSFFLGGFECATHLATDGRRLDIVAASQHDVRAEEDYELCVRIGIKGVREAARWPIADRGGETDLDHVRELARIGRRTGVVQIWDLMHYGYPDEVDPFSSSFERRLALFARDVASVVRDESAGPTYYSPVNEISYNAWAAGEVGYMAPFAKGRGADLKRALVRASISASNAIWEVDPGAVMVAVDPLVRVHAPPKRPDLRERAEHFNDVVVTEAMDMLAGRREPELGGSRRHLGIVGLNYYAGNQWTLATSDKPQRSISPRDARWIPLGQLLLDLQERYGGPFLIGETGASGAQRAGWIRSISREAESALELGVDLLGVCLYPVVTTPDWEDPTAFFDGGVYDVSPEPDGRLARALDPHVAAALRRAQARLDPANLLSWPLAGSRKRGSRARTLDRSGARGLKVARPRSRPTFKADNFTYEVLIVGASLQVERYCLGQGGALPDHRHGETEHAITVLEGEATVRIGDRAALVRVDETIVAPAGEYHGIVNRSPSPLIVQQVSSPKPWDARFQGTHPSQLE